ncbi:MAG: ABC transporter ATP-binding protein [Corynebacteriales bacterium]|nr:ABC transporter ATP-binding protein [Mycobacteriales bacterium]
MKTATSAAIETHDLVITRGGRTIIDGLNTHIASGIITGLLGPSGCGKTTFMRGIVGAQIITSGTITVLGQPAGSAALRKDIGYVTQEASVYADLTVRDNVRYFASLYGLKAREANRAIEDVGLTSHADLLVSNLSGGQRSRASLACAIVATPQLLILDEPTVGLDPVLRRELWQRFRALAESGTTVLVSSHVMDEAAHCDRLLLMREGAFIADETPADVRARTGTQDLEEAFLRLIEAQ